MRSWSVYRNLKFLPNVRWSLRRNGRVQGYATCVMLSRVTMKHANEKQLQRVQNGPREVCQWLNCEDIHADHPSGLSGEMERHPHRLLCDPKHGGFCDEQGNRVDRARSVILLSNGEAWFRQGWETP